MHVCVPSLSSLKVWTSFIPEFFRRRVERRFKRVTLQHVIHRYQALSRVRLHAQDEPAFKPIVCADYALGGSTPSENMNVPGTSFFALCCCCCGWSRLVEPRRGWARGGIQPTGPEVFARGDLSPRYYHKKGFDCFLPALLPSSNMFFVREGW